MDKNSLAHTTWNCKYHIVFAPKYRRQIIYGKLRADIGKILRTLCERKGVTIHEAEACPDHIHMLVSIPPKISVSDFMGYLKGKKFTDDIRPIRKPEVPVWKSEILVSRVLCGYSRSEQEKIEEYIRNQLKEDKEYEQLTMSEVIDPFTGELNKKASKKKPL